MIPNTLRLLRETWIARLNADAALDALAIKFKPTPSVPTTDLQHGARRGFVYVGNEEPTGDMLLDAVIVTTVLGGDGTDSDALDLIDDVRAALLGAALAWSDARLDGIAQLLAYRGSQIAADGEGRLILTARHFTFAARYTNPLPAIFD